ncbi:hypothetical protein [Flavobacterium sp.]|uniref:hypothetical protein n=1 Tax=Flavobacterium sp. TaxID=239 RepID=UPI00286AA71C|nr:hypothetical protein [Flavobacterium sp.]
MKKRLESELISIAHRILKLKNKSEVDQLYKETQKLYETLTVLKFYQDNFESVKSDVSSAVLEEKLELSLEVEETPEPLVEVKEDIVEAVPETEEQIEAALAEESMVSEEVEDTSDSELEEQTAEETLEEELTLEEEVVVEDTRADTEASGELSEAKPSFEPIFELEVEEEEEPEQDIPVEVAFESQPEEKLEDHIGKYADPVFVKPNEVSLFPSEAKEEDKQESEEETPRTQITHDGMSKSIAIGLNDRIGFVQHLFNDSNEDFNRVISQLNTFDTFEEAKNFINEMVIPDYNYWVGEEDYIERFMEIVEKKFS